jgi:hypothetical protein
MVHLVILPLLLCLTSYTFTWALSRYASLRAQWHGHRRMYPPARPWPLVLPALNGRYTRPPT